MTKKQIKQLVLASYKKNELDTEKVDQIANTLNRENLKKYLKELKSEQQKRNVIVAVPRTYGDSISENMFSGLFPEKNIVLTVDPDLLLGFTIKNNDLIYEENLKETLENMLEYVKQ